MSGFDSMESRMLAGISCCVTHALRHWLIMMPLLGGAFRAVLVSAKWPEEEGLKSG
jgi:hypothetical protein